MRRTSAWIVVALFVNLHSTGSAPAAEPIPIGDRWELLVDRYLIERTEGDIELRLHAPTPQEVVMVHDKPWEGNSCGYHTIFQDGPLYRMYYRGWNHDMKTGKQLHPAVARGEDENHQKLLAFISADGLHWQLLRNEPIITEGAFDSQNLAFWDAAREEYRCYFRDFREGRRDIKVAASKDFRRWSKPEWLVFPDAPKEHLYTNAVVPYYRAPHLLIGFPTRYLPDRGSLTEGLFMTSRDGLTFHRWPEAFIRPGLNRDKWHNRSNYTWWGLVETASPLPGASQELSLYTNEGYYFESKAARTRRYTCRIDGFVSLHAALAGGQVLTKPLVFEGDRLAINFSTSAAGGVRVQLEDVDERPIPGFTFADCLEIYGDAIEQIVQWQDGGDASLLAGKPIRLRFTLRDADLYAFGFVGTK